MFSLNPTKILLTTSVATLLFTHIPQTNGATSVPKTPPWYNASYTGLDSQNNTITLTVTKTGAFSGKIWDSGKPKTIKGQFNKTDDQYKSDPISLTNSTLILSTQITEQYQPILIGFELTQTNSENTTYYQITADAKPADIPKKLPGTYHFIGKQIQQPTVFNFGEAYDQSSLFLDQFQSIDKNPCFGTFTILTSGAVTATTTTGNGVTFTQAAKLTKDFHLRYVNSNDSAAIFAYIEVKFPDAEAGYYSGSLEWSTKPTIHYPTPLRTATCLIINKYIKPNTFKKLENSPTAITFTTNAPDMGPGNFKFENGKQILPPGQKEFTTIPLNFKSNGVAQTYSNGKLSANISLNPTTGIITGSIIPPESPSIKYTIRGVCLSQYGDMQGLVETTTSKNGPNIGKFILYKAPIQNP